ncbi:unnamed protein product [Gemmata massiliana]|uniref:Uncharacterized protein n=1 Tax=Gemmata massiliana TaxID=1210884 RepID=A0A6P2DI51_9BACT|nr:serine protease [Gemmata massiliana]VTS01512.1 unnamed protein product [Gemmata massiliana]
MVKTLLLRAAALAVLVSVTGPLFAGDADLDRERKVRVALALAGPSKSKPSAAPAPKEKSPKTGCGCATAPGGVGTCGSYPCPANGGRGPCPCENKSPTSDLGKVRDAVVRVSCGNGSGSGTVVWSEGGRSAVLTAAHVLGTGTDPRVRGNGRWHKAEVLGRDDAADLAVLLVAVELPAVRVAEADPRAGDDVLMVGVTSLWSKGRIVGLDTFNGHECFLFGCDTGADDYSDSGDSGAGVFVRGELVAVHCGKVTLTNFERTPYAASARPIRTLLARVLRRDGSKVIPVATAPISPAPIPTAPTSAAPTYYYPSFGGCSNGSCPAPTIRRGFFR